jgi:hypothetical protein
VGISDAWSVTCPGRLGRNAFLSSLSLSHSEPE